MDDFTTLQQKIAASIAPDQDSGHRVFTLKKGTVVSPALDELFDTIFGSSNRLQIDLDADLPGYSPPVPAGLAAKNPLIQDLETHSNNQPGPPSNPCISTADQTVALIGMGANLFFLDMCVVAVFSLRDGVVHAWFQATDDTPWSLASSFPELETALCAQLTYVRTPPNLPTLTVASYDDNAASIRQGLHFRGEAELASLVSRTSLPAGEGFAFLLANADLTQKLEGEIVYQDHQPTMTLELPASETITGLIPFGFFGNLPQVRVQLVAESLQDPRDGSFYTLCSVVLATTLSFRRGCDLPIQATVSNLKSPIVFRVNVDDVVHGGVQATLDEIKALLSNIDTSGLVSKLSSVGVDLADELTLRTLGIQVLPGSAPTIGFVNVGVESAKSWTLLQGPPQLAVDKLQLDLTVFSPGSTSPALDAYLNASLEVGSGCLDLAAGYPDFAVSAYLVPGTEVSLQDLLRLFTGQSFSYLPDLSLIELHLDVTPGQSFSGGIAAGGDWRFTIGDARFALRDLAAQVSYPEGGPLSLFLFGNFAIGERSIYLEAHSPSRTGEPWTFLAALGQGTPDVWYNVDLRPDSPIDLTDLVPLLTGGAGSAVPSLEIRKLELDVDPAAPTYSGTLAVGDWPPVKVGNVPVAIQSMTLTAGYATATGTTFKLSGSLRLLGTKFKVEADHPKAGDGWQFQGEADFHDGSIGRLLTEIDTQLGLSIPVPPALDDVKITKTALTYNTNTRDFTFGGTGTFGTSAETAIDLAVLSQQDGTFQHLVQGRLTFHPGTRQQLDFALLLDSKPGVEEFVAVYGSQSPTSELDLGGLIAAITGTAAVAVPLKVKDALFAGSGGASPRYLFAIDMGGGINLSALGDLPLVGPALASLATLQLAFQITYATAQYTQAELVGFNKLLPAGGPAFPAAGDLAQGSGLHIQLRLGGAPPIVLALPVSLDSKTGKLQQSKTPPPQTDSTPADSTTTHDGTKWFPIQKAFGPVKIERLGLKVASGTLTGLIDGAVAAFGLEVDLLGLAVTVNLTHDLDFDPHFSLDGLGVSFHQGPVSLAGALFQDPSTNGPEFDGLAVLRSETLALSAIGSFAQLAGDVPSLFVYATLDAPLGGPPFFYVTGLAAGFGYNRSLTVPPVGGLSAFPLVANAVRPPSPPPTDVAGARSFLGDQLKALGDAVAPRQGEYFLAAGVAFTSFRLLESFALLLVAFGERFEIDLVGLSTLSVPPDLGKGEAPLAEAQLALRACVVPEEGTVLAQAQLTPASYVLSRDCHLSGGYAFAAWLPPSPQAGDFVVTLGGYHPRFAVPAHFPRVPRLGVHWQVNDHLTITGGLYYALVPHVFMAGGALSAVWEDGDFRAWFDAGADFLIDWKPFQYSADAYVDIGSEATLHVFGTHHVSFDAGADLEMWGPPFGGHAHVQVRVIGIKVHFDVDFGATKPDKPRIEWPEFQRTFLPPPEQMVSSGIETGLARKIQFQPKAGIDAMRYVVNARQLALTVHSAIPIKKLDSQTQIQVDWGAANTGFGIAPMGKAASAVVTTLKFDVTRDGEPAGSDFQVTPILKPVPAGLWGTQAAAEINSAQSLIAGTASGFRIEPANLPTPGSTRALDRKALEYEPKKISGAWSLPAAAAFTGSPGNWASVDGEIVRNPARDDVLAALGLEREVVTFGQPFQRDSLYPPLTGDLSP